MPGLNFFDRFNSDNIEDDPEPEIVHECTVCGGFIYDGENYGEIGSDKFCDTCLENLGSDWRGYLIKFKLEFATA